MKRSAIHRTSREPIDRRQVRLIHALLAFPVAGVIGFTGHAVVKSVVTESPAITVPAPPERTTDEQTSPRERGDSPDTEGTDTAGAA
jgi:hypothetical protein